jgi:alpha-D-ribose 1-methylphosphonate 5-triphosphate synthase subunit PhnI
MEAKGSNQFWGPLLPSTDTRTRQTPQQHIHAIQRQLVAVAQTQRKSGDIKLEEEKWCETDQDIGRAPLERGHQAALRLRRGREGRLLVLGGGGQVGTQQLSLRVCLYPHGV